MKSSGRLGEGFGKRLCGFYRKASGAATPTLAPLSLSDSAFQVGVPESGTILGATFGSVITSGALPTGFTFNSAARTWAWDGTGSAGTPSIAFTETLGGAIGNPKLTNVGLTITTVVTLNALTLSDAAFVTGTSESGTINGATAGSTITPSGLPTGFTVNGPARTWAWDGTGSAGTPSITLTETLAGATNNPRDSIIGLTVSSPAVTLNALTLSDAAFVTGTSESGTINGASEGSTITPSGLPTGFTVNGAARTWAWSGSGSAGTPTITLSEALAGATNTPRTNNIGLTITDPVTTTMTMPPSLSGENVETGILWGDVGLDSPPTTYSKQWFWGPTDTPRTPFSPTETGDFVTLGQIGGQYVCFGVTPGNGEAIRYSDAVRIHHDTMTPPVLARTSASGGSPVTYSVNYPDNTVTADDIERVHYSLNSDFSTTLWDATRGLTEAAFNPPYTPDDSIDADPAWSTDPPTFNDAIQRYWRRKAISSVTLNGTPIESGWSNTESNFALSSAVTIAAGSSSSEFTVDGTLLNFTHNGGFNQRVGTVTASRTGDRTVDMVIEDVPSLSYLGIGFDDGTYNWTGSVSPEGNSSWKGFIFYYNGADSTATYISTGSSFSYGPNINAGGGFTGWVVGDIMRVRYSPSTNQAVCTRIRSGTETAVLTLTGLPAFTTHKAIFFARTAAEGTLKFTGLSPAVAGGSSEYQ